MIKIRIYKDLIGAKKNFSLSVEESVSKGDFVALFGNSGSGKTTLLRIISGLEKQVNGYISVEDKVWLDSENKTNLSVTKRDIGFVTQQSVLFPNMNVREQLLFAKGDTTDLILLEEVVAIMEIENLLFSYPKHLSGGQKQRVCLARAILQKPKILLLDEPFTGLDYTIRKQLVSLTQKLSMRFECTIFLVSHHPTEIISLANKVWIIENGIIIEKGKPNEVLSKFL